MPEENNSISRGIVGKKLWLFLLILSGNHFLNSPYSIESGGSQYSSFMERFEEDCQIYEQWVRMHGKKAVPKSNTRLHSFVKNNRSKLNAEYEGRKNKLTPHQKKRLEEIGFVKHIKHDKTSNSFAIISRFASAFLDKNGHMDVDHADAILEDHPGYPNTLKRLQAAVAQVKYQNNKRPLGQERQKQLTKLKIKLDTSTAGENNIDPESTVPINFINFTSHPSEDLEASSTAGVSTTFQVENNANMADAEVANETIVNLSLASSVNWDNNYAVDGFNKYAELAMHRDSINSRISHDARMSAASYHSANPEENSNACKSTSLQVKNNATTNLEVANKSTLGASFLARSEKSYDENDTTESDTSSENKDSDEDGVMDHRPGKNDTTESDTSSEKKDSDEDVVLDHRPGKSNCSKTSKSNEVTDDTETYVNQDSSSSKGRQIKKKTKKTTTSKSNEVTDTETRVNQESSSKGGQIKKKTKKTTTSVAVRRSTRLRK